MNILMFRNSGSISEERAREIAQEAINTIKNELSSELQRYDVIETILSIAKEELKTVKIR